MAATTPTLAPSATTPPSPQTPSQGRSHTSTRPRQGGQTTWRRFAYLDIRGGGRNTFPKKKCFEVNCSPEIEGWKNFDCCIQYTCFSFLEKLSKLFFSYQIVSQEFPATEANDPLCLRYVGIKTKGKIYSINSHFPTNCF